jgi:basic amino acid/polyamine antiporter, APA family
VMLWRRRAPDAVRPFRMWLYPLPPLLALVGFGFIVVARPNFGREVVMAATIAGAGLLTWAVREYKLPARASNGRVET